MISHSHPPLKPIDAISTKGTFLGEWDQHYTVRLLDGTFFEFIHNDMMFDRELIDYVVDAAIAHGISIRRHRAHISLSVPSTSDEKDTDRENEKEEEEEEKLDRKHYEDYEDTIWLYQDPPGTGWFSVFGDEQFVHIHTEQDAWNALDWLNDSSEPFFRDTTPRQLSLHAIHTVDVMDEIWEKIAQRTPITITHLRLMNRTLNVLPHFLSLPLKVLSLCHTHLGEPTILDTICAYFPHLEELNIDLRSRYELPDALWGSRLFHETTVALVRWHIEHDQYDLAAQWLPLLDTQYGGMRKGWSDWTMRVERRITERFQRTSHVDEVEWTRPSFGRWGLLLDDV